MGHSVNGAFAVLLTSDSYYEGVKVLHWSLKSVKSAYPLVVLYTCETVSQAYVQRLEGLGCIVKETSYIQLEGSNNNYAQAYYADMWTKLQGFSLTEYSRVVMVDADMLIRQNVDDLMTMELPEGWIAASSGCLCNPMKAPTYPATWVPENCPYTYFGDEGRKVQARTVAYFNAGLIVVEPSKAEFGKMMAELNRIEDVEKYIFADQDFLNKFYAGRWICLPYSYNALRPLSRSHPNMWRDDEIKIVHYIFKKPWLDEEWKSQSEEERIKNEFYTVNSWWYEAYEKSKIE